jgi:hypothetical protein
MKVSRFEPRNCWRVQVPARWSDNRKPHAEYFKTKEEGNAFIADKFNRPGSNHSVHMPMSDKVYLEKWRALLGSNEGIEQAIEFYQKTVLSVKKQGTVFELLAAYMGWQETMNRTPDGSKAINHWAGRFGQAFGNEMVTALNYSDLSKWINSHPGGKGHSGRRNAYVFAHALLNWAQKNGWLAQDILKGMDKPRGERLKKHHARCPFRKGPAGLCGIGRIPIDPASASATGAGWGAGLRTSRQAGVSARCDLLDRFQLGERLAASSG